MATNGNGMMGKVVLWLAGVVVTLICFIAIPSLATNMINNDKDSRKRDKTQDDKIAATQADITGIKTDLSWLKASFHDYRAEQRAVNNKILDKLG